MIRIALFTILTTVVATAQPGAWEQLSSTNAASKWTGGIGLPFPSKAWVVEGDTLHLAHPRAGGSLYSANQFENFELIFEWRISPAGNSGVKYMGVARRIHPDFHRFFTRPAARSVIVAILVAAAILLALRWIRWGRRWLAVIVILGTLGWIGFIAASYWRAYQRTLNHPTGLEYQVTDDTRNSDAISKVTHRTGALYDMIAPTGGELRPIDQFNESRIVVQGLHVEHWLNGRNVLEYEFGSQALRQALAKSKFAGEPGFAVKSAGYLELQNHDDEVWFRNMRIRRL